MDTQTMEAKAIQPHQQRVLDEMSELDAKHKKLGEFFRTPIFKGLPDVERSLLRLQFNAMARYAAVLAARIALFDLADD